MTKPIKLDNSNFVVLTQLYDYIGRVFDYDDWKHIQTMINQQLITPLESLIDQLLEIAIENYSYNYPYDKDCFRAQAQEILTTWIKTKNL